MNSFRIFILLGLVLIHSSLAAQTIPPSPVRNLSAVWNEGSATHRSISLSWSSADASSTGFVIERKIGAGAWTTVTQNPVLSATATSFTDTAAVARTTAGNVFVYYRVRAKGSGTVVSGAAEVATVGVPSVSVWSKDAFDEDADGMTNAAEINAGLNPLDWSDASGDADGDLIPNAWEAQGISTYQVTVDANRTLPDTATETKTITAALAKLTGTTNNYYRAILVKPGVYRENISHTTAYQVALIADRSGGNPKLECEIQAVTTAAAIATTGSLVLDGFVLTRAAGTQGPAVVSSESATPAARVSIVRMTNCIVRQMNNGADSIIEQTRGRVVLSHNTFYMNSVVSGSRAHSYTAGALTGTSPLESTARLRVMNCVFWNPINTEIPEFESVGDFQIQTSIVYGGGLSGTVSVNPGLTPKGYLLSPSSSAAYGGSLGAQTLKDMHGELRYAPPGRGADDWNDQDNDLIPDFADQQPFSHLNAALDEDEDQLTDLGEYQSGTSLTSADSQYLTLEQAMRVFPSSQDFLTRSEADARYLRANSSSGTPLQKIRIAPGGNISMGIFQ